MSQNRSTAVMQRRHVTVDKLDYYPTPPWAARAFMREVLAADLADDLAAWGADLTDLEDGADAEPEGHW